MSEIKARFLCLRSTIAGIAVLIFLAFAVYMEPELLRKPESLVLLGAGIAGLLSKR